MTQANRTGSTPERADSSHDFAAACRSPAGVMRTAAGSRRPGSPVQGPFDLLQERGDAVQRVGRAAAGRDRGSSDSKRPFLGLHRRGQETASQRLVHRLLEGMSGAPGLGLELGRDVFIEGQRGSHIMMLEDTHRDVERPSPGVLRYRGSWPAGSSRTCSPPLPKYARTPLPPKRSRSSARRSPAESPHAAARAARSRASARWSPSFPRCSRLRSLLRGTRPRLRRQGGRRRGALPGGSRRCRSVPAGAALAYVQMEPVVRGPGGHGGVTCAELALWAWRAPGLS